jgi:hypothetical protein
MKELSSLGPCRKLGLFRTISPPTADRQLTTGYRLRQPRTDWLCLYHGLRDRRLTTDYRLLPFGFVSHESSPQSGRSSTELVARPRGSRRAEVRPQPKPARAETRRRRETPTVIAERDAIPAQECHPCEGRGGETKEACPERSRMGRKKGERQMPLPSQRSKADYRLRTTDNRLSTVPFVVSMSFDAADLQPLCIGLLPLFTFQCSLHLNSSVPIIRISGWAVKGNLGTIEAATDRAGPRAVYLGSSPRLA